MAGWLFYLFIVMMIVPFGGSAQYNIARNVGFVSCGIRAINHQMIIARSSIRRNYNIVVMDVRRFLSGDIIRPVETEIDSGFARSSSTPRVSKKSFAVSASANDFSMWRVL